MRIVPKQAKPGHVFSGKRQVNPPKKTSKTDVSETFSETLHSVSVNIKSTENGKQKNRRNKDEGCQIPDVSITKLQEMYRREYQSFKAMRYERCGKNGKYELDPSIGDFRLFLEAFGPKPDPSYTLDRLDPSNHVYSSENCVWASKQRQSENRTSVRYLTDDSGVCLSVTEWSRRTGIARGTILNRVDRLGWSQHDAVHTPTNGRPKNTEPSIAINCKFNSCRLDGASPREPSSNSPIPTRISPANSALVEAYRAALAKHGIEFFVAEKKDIKILKDVAVILRGGGLDALKVIPAVLHDWPAFTAYAERDFGAYKSPTNPTLGYLRKNVQAVGNYLLQLQQEAEAEAKREIEVSEEEKRLKEQAEALDKRKAEDAKEYERKKAQWLKEYTAHTGKTTLPPHWETYKPTDFPSTEEFAEIFSTGREKAALISTHRELHWDSESEDEDSDEPLCLDIDDYVGE